MGAPDPAARTEPGGPAVDEASGERPRASDVPAPALAGQTIAGRFRLVRLIGRGGMGEVHEAEHIELGRRVAVKIMHGRAATNRTSMTRLKREARSLASLAHPNIVQVLDAGEHEGWPYIAMELLQGEDLRTRLDREGPMPVGETITITSQILAGLDAVHAGGVVHRDVKPENIFLTKAADGSTFVKILDFGVSKLMEIDSSAGNLTESGTIVGSPAFMAPEQAIGSAGVDARTDLYSVGALLYTMLAGRAPFAAPNIPAVLLAIVEGRCEPLGNLRPGLPTALIDLVAKAMDKERGKRFKTASEFATALQTVAPTGVHVAEVRPRGLGTKLPYIAIAAGLAVAVGWFALSATTEPTSIERDRSAERRSRPPPREKAPAPAKVPPAPPAKQAATPAARTARLQLLVTPARAATAARATLGGRALAGLDVEVPLSETPRVLRVEADGFAPFETELSIREDTRVEVALRGRGGKRQDGELWRPMGIEKNLR
jgi:serine/threonine-protein kinase